MELPWKCSRGHSPGRLVELKLQEYSAMSKYSGFRAPYDDGLQKSASKIFWIISRNPRRERTLIATRFNTFLISKNHTMCSENLYKKYLVNRRRCLQRRQRYQGWMGGRCRRVMAIPSC